jgi:hypothetical protein
MLKKKAEKIRFPVTDMKRKNTNMSGKKLGEELKCLPERLL